MHTKRNTMQWIRLQDRSPKERSEVTPGVVDMRLPSVVRVWRTSYQGFYLRNIGFTHHETGSPGQALYLKNWFIGLLGRGGMGEVAATISGEGCLHRTLIEDCALIGSPDIPKNLNEKAMTGVFNIRSRGTMRFAFLQWVEDLGADLRYGFRTFRRNTAFAVTAVVSLALGIGANAAIFSTLYAVVWKPLPVSKPEELVRISLLSNSGLRDVPTIGFIRQLRSAGVFEGVTATSMDGLSFSYDARAERVLGEFVSGSYFDVLGVRPIVGQPFTPEVRSGRGAAEAVLSYSFWQRRFGGDPSVVGRTIRLNTYPFTIAGVAPPGFQGLERGTDVDIRIPILPDGQELEQIARISGRLDRGQLTIARIK